MCAQTIAWIGSNSPWEKLLYFKNQDVSKKFIVKILDYMCNN